MFIIQLGGFSVMTPNSVRANRMNMPPMTRFVTGCVAKAMMTGPTTTPISTKISTMPAPYISDSGSVEPLLAEACFVKKLMVIGIIG